MGNRNRKWWNNYYNNKLNQRISVLERAGHSISFIADHPGVSKSTVNRELERNASKFGSSLFVLRITNLNTHISGSFKIIKIKF